MVLPLIYLTVEALALVMALALAWHMSVTGRGHIDPGCPVAGDCLDFFALPVASFRGLQLSDLGIFASASLVGSLLFDLDEHPVAHRARRWILGVAFALSVALQVYGRLATGGSCAFCLGYCILSGLSLAMSIARRSGGAVRPLLKIAVISACVMIGTAVASYLSGRVDVVKIRHLSAAALDEIDVLGESLDFNSTSDVRGQLYAFLDPGCKVCRSFAQSALRRTPDQLRLSILLLTRQSSLEKACLLHKLYDEGASLNELAVMLGSEAQSGTGLLDCVSEARLPRQSAADLMHAKSRYSGIVASNRLLAMHLGVSGTPAFVYRKGRAYSQITLRHARELLLLAADSR